MVKARLCLNCKHPLYPADGAGVAIEINGFCKICNIYYNDDEPIALIKGDKIIFI